MTVDGGSMLAVPIGWLAQRRILPAWTLIAGMAIVHVDCRRAVLLCSSRMGRTGVAWAGRWEEAG